MTDLDGMRCVFVTGARQVGKRAVAEILASTSAGRPWVIDGFEWELRERCHAAHRIVDPQGRPAPWHVFQPQIDVPLEPFAGNTPRQAYNTFRTWSVMAFPAGQLGQWITQRVRMFRDFQEAQKMPLDKRFSTLCIPDMGEMSDYYKVIDAFGPEKCTQVHVTRKTAQAESGNIRNIDNTPPLSLGIRLIEVRNPGDTFAGLDNELSRVAACFRIQIATTLPS